MEAAIIAAIIIILNIYAVFIGVSIIIIRAIINYSARRIADEFEKRNLIVKKEV